MKKVVVIDGQGGKIGRELCDRILERIDSVDLIAIGTNSAATANMLKGKASQGATGENPVVVACRDADVIAGPIGIVISDSLLGEVTPLMAKAIGQSKAEKVLIPVNRCSNHVVGVKNLSVNDMIEEAVMLISELV